MSPNHSCWVRSQYSKDSKQPLHCLELCGETTEPSPGHCFWLIDSSTPRLLQQQVARSQRVIDSRPQLSVGDLINRRGIRTSVGACVRWTNKLQTSTRHCPRQAKLLRGFGEAMCKRSEAEDPCAPSSKKKNNSSPALPILLLFFFLFSFAKMDKRRRS